MSGGRVGMVVAGLVAALGAVLLVLVLTGNDPFGFSGGPEPSIDPLADGAPAPLVDTDGAADSADPTGNEKPSLETGGADLSADGTAPVGPVVPSDDAVGAGQIRMRVISKRNSAPLVGAVATLTLETAPDATPISSEPTPDTGQALVVGLATGSYTLRVERPGCTGVERKGVSVGERVGLDLGDIALVPSPALTGTVTDLKEVGVGGATVVVANEIALKFGPDMDIFKALEQLKSDELVFASVTADALGAYIVWWDQVNPGSAILRASHSGHAIAFASVTFDPAVAVEKDLKLGTPGTYSGRVVDHNDLACPNCRVVLMPEPDQRRFMIDRKMVFFRTQVMTDVEGRFVFEKLRPGTYMLWTGGGKYATQMENRVTVPSEDVVVKLKEAMSLTGRVTDKSNGTPIVGAQVGAGGDGGFDVTTTDEDGRYHLKGLSVGRIQMFAKAKGYTMYEGSGPKVVPGDVVFDIQLTSGVIIGGRVVHGAERGPVAGATVIAVGGFGGMGMGGMPSAKTDAQGQFALKGVNLEQMRRRTYVSDENGQREVTEQTVQLTLVVQAPGLIQPKPLELKFRIGELPSNVELRMEPATKVTGRVVDAAGKGVAGIEVSAVQLEGANGRRSMEMTWALSMWAPETRVKSDAQGHFTLPSVRPGARAQVLTRDRKYPTSRSTPFEARPGETVQNVIVRLVRGTRVVVRAVDGSGEPIAEQKVNLTREIDRSDPAKMAEQVDPAEMMFGGAKQADTNAAGIATFEGVGIGTFAVSVEGPLVPDQKLIVIVDGKKDVVTVDLRLQRGLEIRGIVRGVGGNPAESVYVSVRSEPKEGEGDPFHGSAQTNSRGEFEVKGLRPGEYKLSVWGGEKGRADEITVTAGDTTVSVLLKKRQ